ncbi:hypothetical protein BaRGS_00012196 [Batillaria attramentaria]|uniref:Uncharacterized protein n=1 Tax=Batillaria attramentaria TaxID=370345 RepID=A0ABD0LAR5_9CAEN
MIQQAIREQPPKKTSKVQLDLSLRKNSLGRERCADACCFVEAVLLGNTSGGAGDEVQQSVGCDGPGATNRLIQHPTHPGTPSLRGKRRAPQLHIPNARPLSGNALNGRGTEAKPPFSIKFRLIAVTFKILRQSFSIGSWDRFTTAQKRSAA